MRRSFATGVRKGCLSAIMLAALVLAGPASPAIAQSTAKIGFMTTLTGPHAVLGQHARDGFNLGLKHSGGKLGGLDAQVVIAESGPRRHGAVLVGVRRRRDQPAGGR